MTDISEARQCSDLYDILESCTNEELTPIVDILVNSPESVLRISRAFECHAPDHVRYRDRIGDEVYRLGLQALGTGAIKRPSYAEMIARLCKQIGFASVPDNIDRNEGTLLNLFSKQYLSFIPASGDQQPQINEASTAISAAVRGILSSDAWAPFASIMLHMIYLRRKLVGEGRVPSSTTVDHHAVGREDTENTVVIQAENGDPVLALATIPDDGSQGWPDMQASLKVADALAPLLKAAEPFFSAQEMLKGGNYYRARLPAGAELSFSKKLGHCVGTAKNHKGMVALDPASAARLASPAMLLTLMSAVVEQQKLKNIEKSLDEIKSSIQDVSRFQQDERHATITGAIRYFQQVAPGILSGELAPEILHEIERHEVDLMRVQEHLLGDIRNQIATFHAIKKEGWGSSKYTTALQEGQAVLERLYDEAMLCVRARGCGYQLLCAYPGRESGKKARLGDISSLLGLLSPTGEVGALMDQVLREKIQIAPSYEIKALLLNREDALFERIGTESTSIIESLKNAVQKISERTTPITVDIKLQDGAPVAIRMH